MGSISFKASVDQCALLLCLLCESRWKARKKGLVRRFPKESSSQFSSQRQPSELATIEVSNVSGEVVGIFEYDRNLPIHVRKIKAAIKSKVGGRLALLSLLHNDQLLDDSANLIFPSEPSIMRLTLVRQSAARLACLPVFEGLYLEESQGRNGVADFPVLGIDSAEFHETASFPNHCAGIIRFLCKGNPGQITVEGFSCDSGKLHLRAVCFSDEDQEFFGHEITMQVACDGNTIQLDFSEIAQVTLTRIPKEIAGDWENIFSDEEAQKAHLQEIIDCFVQEIVFIGIDVMAQSGLSSKSPLRLRMDNKLSQLQLLHKGTEKPSVPVVIPLKHVTSLQKVASLNQALLNVVQTNEVETSLGFKNAKVRDEAYTCLRIFCMNAQTVRG